MTHLPHRLARVLAGAISLVAFVATLTVAPVATGVVADGPHYQEPTAGQCRNYTIKQAMLSSNRTAAIHCTEPHTAVTAGVSQLPDSLTWSSNRDTIMDFISTECGKAFRSRVGATPLLRRQTMFSLWWFEPNQDQKDHGARWIRCDIALGGHGGLVPLPSNDIPFLDPADMPYKATTCLYGTQSLYTACVKSHHHRATGGFAVTDGPYPGDDALVRAGKRRCPGYLTSRTGVFVHPTRESWKQGDRFIICFSKTTH